MQAKTLIILLSTTAEAPEMQTLLPHGNVMNLVAFCLYEVSWTELIEALKDPGGVGGKGLVRLHRCWWGFGKKVEENQTQGERENIKQLWLRLLRN